LRRQAAHRQQPGLSGTVTRPPTFAAWAFPKGPKAGPNPRYWTGLFWSNNGTAIWDGGFQNTYIGFHPYPNPAPDSDNQEEEISANSNDILTGEAVTWNRWYTQVFRCWRESASLTHHEYYYDYDLWISSGGSDGMIDYDINFAGWADTMPPIPCICIGQAPDIEGVGASSGQSWGGYAGYEEYKGILRGFQWYDALLSMPQVASELATPGSARTPWYLNRNPTLLDVSDKSGNGNHPLWDGADRPTLWTA
jgi:hypothetical protein